MQNRGHSDASPEGWFGSPTPSPVLPSSSQNEKLGGKISCTKVRKVYIHHPADSHNPRYAEPQTASIMEYEPAYTPKDGSLGVRNQRIEGLSNPLDDSKGTYNNGRRGGGTTVHVEGPNYPHRNGSRGPQWRYISQVEAREYPTTRLSQDQDILVGPHTFEQSGCHEGEKKGTSIWRQIWRTITCRSC